MWLFDVRSTRSDVERRGGAGQERFQWKAAQCYECAFTHGQHGFHSAVGANRRYDLLVRGCWWVPQPN